MPVLALFHCRDFPTQTEWLGPSRLQGVSSDVTPGHPRPRSLVQVSLSSHEEGAESPEHLRPRTRPSRPGWQQRRGWP